MAKELEKRGWQERKDSDSLPASFRFTALIKDSRFDSLSESQMCNHLRGITELSLKSNLVKNSRLIPWKWPTDLSLILPLTFCIPDQDRLEDFQLLFEHIQVF